MADHSVQDPSRSASILSWVGASSTSTLIVACRDSFGYFTSLVCLLENASFD